MDVVFLQSTFLRLIQGVPLTLQLAFLSVTVGLFFALLLGFAMRARFLPLALTARVYVFVFRGTPLLVQLEIVRGGLQSAPAGQVEAARAFGMSGFTLYRRIIGPIALRQALPAYGNELILMVKATALGSTVTLMELTGIAHKLISETFRAVEIFLVAGSIYLLMNFILTRLVAWGERAIAPDLAAQEAARRDRDLQPAAVH